MLLGVILARHPYLERRCAPLAHLRGVGQSLAGLADLPKRRRPDKRAINIAALPGCRNFCRLQVHHFDFRAIQPPVLQGAEQAVVGGRNERCGDGFSDQIFRFFDAATVANHQRFGRIDLG
ncbi:hypothetical protein D3C72_1618790 [compost metagenome]